MSKKLVILFLLLLAFLAPEVHAQLLNDCPYSPVARTDPPIIFSDPTKTPRATFYVNVGDNNNYFGWKIQFECGIFLFQSVSGATKEANGTDISRTMNNGTNACEFFAGNHTLKVIAVNDKGQEIPQCIAKYTIANSDTQCQLDISPQTGITANTNDMTVSGENLTKDGKFGVFMDGKIIKGQGTNNYVATPNFSGVNVPSNLLTPNTHKISLRKDNGIIPRGSPLEYGSDLCSVTFTVGTPNNPGSIIKDPARGSPIPIQPAIAGGQEAKGCTDAKYPNGSPNPGIATAIGCIHTNPAEFVKDLMTWVLGIGGGLAFLMMLLGAFQMLTSAGNPETLNAGRERLTSAVIGLLFIIFAMLLLQIIGFDILKIPGFGR